MVNFSQLFLAQTQLTDTFLKKKKAKKKKAWLFLTVAVSGGLSLMSFCPVWKEQQKSERPSFATM